MNIINILDKSKADELFAMGFNYKIKEVQDKTIYEFIGTPELVSCLNGKFSKQDYFIKKTFNF